MQAAALLPERQADLRCQEGVQGADRAHGQVARLLRQVPLHLLKPQRPPLCAARITIHCPGASQLLKAGRFCLAASGEQHAALQDDCRGALNLTHSRGTCCEMNPARGCRLSSTRLVHSGSITVASNRVQGDSMSVCTRGASPEEKHGNVVRCAVQYAVYIGSPQPPPGGRLATWVQLLLCLLG